MAIKAVDIFRQDPLARLDFSEGQIDMIDFFNNLVVPLVNELDPESAEEDPFIAQANQDALRFTEASSEPLAEFGFQAPIQQLNETPILQPDTTQSNPPPPRRQVPSEPLGGGQRAVTTADRTPASQQRTGSFDPASFTFEREARRDSGGNLRVYSPPSGDGGGAYEVAGITARYQPQEAAALRSLIQQGRSQEAEEQAKSFFRRRAEPFTRHASQSGLQLQIADTVHHRGEGGLRQILQLATGSESKSYEALINQLDNDPESLQKFNRARVNYELEEVDRGRKSRQKFRQGLLNRFEAAYQASIEANQQS